MMKLRKDFLLNENFDDTTEYTDAQIEHLRRKCLSFDEFIDEYASENGDLFTNDDNATIRRLSDVRDDHEFGEEDDYIVSSLENNQIGMNPEYVVSFIGKDFNLTYINWGENYELHFPGVIETDRITDEETLSEIFLSDSEDPEAEKEVGQLPSEDFE